MTVAWKSLGDNVFDSFVAELVGLTERHAAAHATAG